VSIKHIEVFAPASIANLGPGFDVFGLAIEGLGDTVKLSKIKGEEIIITVDGVPRGSIPLEPLANSSGAVVKAVMEDADPGNGFKIDIFKGVRPGIGLGSSGASAAATAFGVNILLSLGLSRDELVGFLEKNGVETIVSWRIPNHLQPALNLSHFKLSETEKLSREVVSLPIYPELKDEQVRYVINVIHDFYKKI